MQPKLGRLPPNCAVANRIAALASAAAPAEQPSEIENLRKALQFYANGEHFMKADEHAWDTVSGEPQNYWCDEAGTATVEDGTIARLALAGHQIKFDADDAPQPSPTPQADSQPAPVVGTVAHVGTGKTTLTGAIASALRAALLVECDSPELCAVSRSCAGQFGTKRICASRGQAPAQQGVQWQCGPQASGFTVPQADSVTAPAAGAVAGPALAPSAFVNAAGIKADDKPGTVVRKLDAAFHDKVTFADATSTPPTQAADSVPVAPFDDPKVQVVYAILCDDADTPKGEHWEGFAARRIVDALSADSVLEDAARWERERICAAIKAEDDYCVDQGDYMLDSDDCIKIVRGEWVRPDSAVDAARKQGGAA